jgi:hypothetical protein
MTRDEIRRHHREQTRKVRCNCKKRPSLCCTLDQVKRAARRMGEESGQQAGRFIRKRINGSVMRRRPVPESA